MMEYDEKLELYSQALEKAGIRKKGETLPYSSINGNMFSQMNKEGGLGLRFSDDVKEKYIAEFNSGTFSSYGKELKGYVLIPEGIIKDTHKLSLLLKESRDYVSRLPKK